MPHLQLVYYIPATCCAACNEEGRERIMHYMLNAGFQWEAISLWERNVAYSVSVGFAHLPPNLKFDISHTASE